MHSKTKLWTPTGDDLRQLIICDTDFSEVGETDRELDTMQRLEQLGWLAEGDESGEYTLTDAGRLAVLRALGEVVALVQLKAGRVGRTYIAGPMTGHADFNYPAFNAAAAQMRSMGVTAINPADHGVVPGATWDDYLRSDIAQLATCESIYFLPGWSKSRGALLEHHIATSLGMRLLFAEGAERQISPTGQGDAMASLPLYRLADDEDGTRGLHRDDTGSWVKLQDVERALAARQTVRIYGCCAQLEGELHTADCPNMRPLVAARQPVGDVQSNPLLAIARRNIRQFLAKATFASEMDRFSAGRCVDVMEAAIGTPPSQAMDLGHARVIELLLTVAEAAYTLADSANDMEDCEHVEHADFVALSDALDALDQLPDDQPGYTMSEPAKARWALRALIGGQVVGNG